MSEHKTKIIVFSPLYPPSIGGLESHAKQFNYHLSKKGYTITVITPITSSGGKNIQIKGNITIQRFPAFEVIPNWHFPKVWHPLFWSIIIKAVKQRPDLVISRTRFFFTSIMALIYAKTTSTPWVHIEHGSDHSQLNSKITSTLAKTYDHTLGALVLRQANQVIANSNASKQFIKKLAPKKEVHVIYRGVNQKNILSIPANKEIDKNNNIIISYAGRLIDGKGISDMLIALSQTNNKYWHCYIAGDGPQKKALKEQVKKLNLTNQVTFTGFLSPSKTIGLLKSTDIFINPSYTEGMPSSVIEAALCKCAIIATNVGGTNEIINSTNAILVSPRNPKQLQSSISILLRNKQLREKKSLSSHEAVINKFTWSNSISKYQELFQKILTK